MTQRSLFDAVYGTDPVVKPRPAADQATAAVCHRAAEGGPMMGWLWRLYVRLLDRAAVRREARLRRDRELGRPVDERLERLHRAARAQRARLEREMDL